MAEDGADGKDEEPWVAPKFLCWECGAVFGSVGQVTTHEGLLHAGRVHESPLSYHIRMMASHPLYGKDAGPDGKKNVERIIA